MIGDLRIRHSWRALPAVLALLAALLVGVHHHHDADHHGAVTSPCAVCVLSHHAPAEAGAVAQAPGPRLHTIGLAAHPAMRPGSVVAAPAVGRAPPFPFPTVA